MGLVKEHINFKRIHNSKDSLGIGEKSQIKILQDLLENQLKLYYSMSDPSEDYISKKETLDWAKYFWENKESYNFINLQNPSEEDLNFIWDSFFGWLDNSYKK